MFRFTIRDVLWLTVLVALAVCWWLDDRSLRMRLEAQAREHETYLEGLLVSLERQRRLEKVENAPIITTGGGFPGGQKMNGFPRPSGAMSTEDPPDQRRPFRENGAAR